MSDQSIDSFSALNSVRISKLLRILKSARIISFVDLEMSGGNPELHSIIQEGGVLARFPSLQSSSWFEQKVKPRTLEGCQWRALRIAHFSWKRWRNAIPIFRALKILRHNMAHAIAAFWDPSQDLKFIYAQCQREGMPPPEPLAYLDVQEWAQDRLNLPYRPALQTVADMLKIPRRRKHDALEDSRATYHIFRMLWLYSPGELEAVVATLDANRELPTDSIVLPPERLQERLRELVKYMSTDPTVFMRHQKPSTQAEEPEQAPDLKRLG
jgi:DNA polymerase III epsilon subunit-like protein